MPQGIYGAEAITFRNAREGRRWMEGGEGTAVRKQGREWKGDLLLWSKKGYLFENRYESVFTFWFLKNVGLTLFPATFDIPYRVLVLADTHTHKTHASCHIFIFFISYHISYICMSYFQSSPFAELIITMQTYADRQMKGTINQGSSPFCAPTRTCRLISCVQAVVSIINLRNDSSCRSHS